MKTKTLTIILITLCCSAFLAMTTAVSAQTIVVGVSKGETFDYSYNILWTSTNPSSTPSNEYLELNNTQKIQFKITDISGSIITVDLVRYFKNGTNNIQSGTINIDSGTVTIPFGFLVIGANLSKNQQVYPNGGHQLIADTVTRSYSNGQRETNVIISEGSDETTTIYFDKVKGIAVEYSYQTTETFNDYTTTIREEMTNTNSDVWSIIPEFSSTIALMLLLIAIPIVLVAYKKKGLSNHKFALPLKS